MIPVSPAMRNWKRKATQNSMGVSNRILPPYIVAIQLKILIPVGTPTSMVEVTKKMVDTMTSQQRTCGEPTHRPQDSDLQCRADHRRPPEHRFPRENRNNLRGARESRNYQDIDLRVP